MGKSVSFKCLNLLESLGFYSTVGSVLYPVLFLFMFGSPPFYMFVAMLAVKDKGSTYNCNKDDNIHK